MTQLVQNFNRPADVNPYAVGDLVANNVVAGNVAPMQFALPDFAGAYAVLRGRLWKSGAAIANAAFMLHLFEAPPVVANGDNGVLATTGSAGYLGSISFGSPIVNGAGNNPFSDGARFDGVPVTGSSLLTRLKARGAVLYGLLEARGAYTPANAEQFAVTLELAQME